MCEQLHVPVMRANSYHFNNHQLPLAQKDTTTIHLTSAGHIVRTKPKNW